MEYQENIHLGSVDNTLIKFFLGPFIRFYKIYKHNKTQKLMRQRQETIYQNCVFHFSDEHKLYVSLNINYN